MECGKRPRRQTFLPLAQPVISEEEIDAVSEVLRSGWLTTGPKVEEFEERFKRYIGCEYAVALNSCTAGLHLALEAFGIGPGDEVISSTLTFAATGHVIDWVGAKPVLVDVNPVTCNIDPAAVEAAVTPRTRAIIPVHYAGLACEMEQILALARKHDLRVIEDAAHAVGTRYRGGKIGSFGDVTVFSFYAIKNMTTAEGGMVTTADGKLAEKIRKLSYFGIDKNAFSRYDQRGRWYYEIESLGYKYNMDALQGALGLVQLTKLDSLLNKRALLAHHYLGSLSGMSDIQLPPCDVSGDKCRLGGRAGSCESGRSWHLFPVQIDFNHLGISRDAFIGQLQSANIGSSVHFIPLHLHPYYQHAHGFRPGQFPGAEASYERLISLPLHPKMEYSDVDDVVAVIADVVRNSGL